MKYHIVVDGLKDLCTRSGEFGVARLAAFVGSFYGIGRMPSLQMPSLHIPCSSERFKSHFTDLSHTPKIRLSSSTSVPLSMSTYVTGASLLSDRSDG